MKKSVCNTCVYAVNNNHCGLRGFRSDFNVKYCSAQNTDKLPNGFELQEDGYFSWVNKKSKYPTTYEECCRIVNANPYIRLIYDLSNGQRYSYDADNLQLYEKIRQLLICRDAYWKITGEGMGLGKPWEPDYIEESFEQGSPIKYVIYYTGTNIEKCIKCTPSYILSFPTEEMRDAFYENFKDLIERCKELL